MNQNMQRILSTFDMKGAKIRNRLALAPMTRVSASADGSSTAAMAKYYARFARGGFGLVMTEGLYTDHAWSQGYTGQPGMADDSQARSWTATNDELHRHGALAFAQLMHAGALSQANPLYPGTIAPSPVRPQGKQMAFYHGDGPYALPAEMTAEQIALAITSFAAAAGRAVRIAGFDGIEIHAANGYLLDQFLGAHTNLRGDRWGGDVHGRLRLTLEILTMVKREVGSTVPVGVRISQGKVNDFTHKWPGGTADAEAIFGALAKAGADFIHVTEFEAWQPAFDGDQDSLIALARRHAPGVAILANGNLHDAARAREALAQGADMVAVGRGALANPDLPQRWRDGVAQHPFDGALLSPIAHIKESELAFGASSRE